MDDRVPGAEGNPLQRRSLPLPEDLRERIGQMVLVGFRGLTGREAQPTIRDLTDGKIGSVVLFDVDGHTDGQRNIQSREQLRDLVADLKAASKLPLLVTVDAEGGFYHRLREKYGFAPANTAAEMGEQNALAFTRAAAGSIASELADVGINMNLAPVLDLINPVNMEVAARRRCFSSDPGAVTAHAREFILAHHDHGVLACAKHFPGMGGAVRLHEDNITESIDAWSVDELEPYRAFAKEDLLDAVMATRVAVTQLDPDMPACLSPKIVDGLLRRELGFDGVVMTDAMENSAIWEAYGFERGTILAVNAGVDILFYCNIRHTVPYTDDRPRDVIEVILDAVARGEIPESRINEACGRILALKARLPAN